MIDRSYCQRWTRSRSLVAHFFTVLVTTLAMSLVINTVFNRRNGTLINIFGMMMSYKSIIKEEKRVTLSQ
jgi:hypothetical protein